jgi:hypothetical protein
MISAPDFTDPAAAACVDLTGRAGASQLQIGHLDDDPADPRWYASAYYRGMRIMTEEHPTAAEAATDLAGRILNGGTCRCRKPVTLTGGDGCRWTLVGSKWVPGCNVESILMPGGMRGDYAAMKDAMMTEPEEQPR